MNTTTDKTLSVVSMPKAQEVEKEQDIKDWAQYSQWIAAAMKPDLSPRFGKWIMSMSK